MTSSEIKVALANLVPQGISIEIADIPICFKGGTVLRVTDLADGLHQIAHYRCWERRAAIAWKPRHDKRCKRRAHDLCWSYNVGHPFSLRGRYTVDGNTVVFQPEPAPERDFSKMSKSQLVAIFDGLADSWSDFKNDLVQEMAFRLARRFNGMFPQRIRELNRTFNEEQISVLETEPVWNDFHSRISGTWQWMVESNRACSEKTIREGRWICGFGRELWQMTVALMKQRQKSR